MADLQNCDRAPSPQSTSLEQRRQQALSAAQECEQILRSYFGAEQVILFGSLAGDGPWHWQSDLDLAVAGLSHSVWSQAYGQLEAIVPPWLKIDLIRLETVDPAVRARILKEKPMSDNKYLALKDRLADELTALNKTVLTLETALQQAKTVPEDFAIRTLASYINDIYRRCERISERVAATLDSELPQGENWHRALLRQLAEVSGGDRSPLWAGSLLLDLDEYRKFRHVHHKYGDELRADYVVGLAEQAPAMVEKVQQAIAHFNQWLTQQADASAC